MLWSDLFVAINNHKNGNKISGEGMLTNTNYEHEKKWFSMKEKSTDIVQEVTENWSQCNILNDIICEV